MGALGCYAGRRIWLYALAVLFCGAIGCEQKRPPGFLWIGKIAVIAQKSGFLEDKQIYLHRDERGLAAMSTLCSHDLSKLYVKKVDGREILVSEFNDSQYDLWGHVLRGPATKELPFYRLRADAEEYGGPIDSLYVEIGKEVGRDWRLSQ